MDDLYEAMSAANLNPQHDHAEGIDEDDPIGVGDVVWFIHYRTKDKKEMARLVDFIDEHFAVKVTYCSLAERCWAKCSEKGKCT